MALKHPNCSTREQERPCDDPYCPIHGRIRNMDAGASPFVDPDAVWQEKVAAAGLTEDQVRDAYADPSTAYDDQYERRLRREAQEADARMESALDEKFSRLKGAAPRGCICTYHETDGGPVMRDPVAECPVDHDGIRDAKYVDRFGGDDDAA
jgi:hypothetical protein